MIQLNTPLRVQHGTQIVDAEGIVVAHAVTPQVAQAIVTFVNVAALR